MPNSSEKKYMVEIYKSRGSWYWRLRHRNGNIVADGAEGKRRRIECKRTFWRMAKAFADPANIGERVVVAGETKGRTK